MAAASRTKSADRAGLVKKLLPLVKKHYPKLTLPRVDLPVMETMLFAVCLEDASVEQADAAYARLFEVYPDLNEARVSSITELAQVFAGMPDPDWRAFRCRAILQYVFEKSFTFEFESLRKKTLELGVKQLAKIKQVTPFVRSYTLQVAIGSHILPLDETSRLALVWLGLITPELSGEDAGENLKTMIRKAESPLFCTSIRSIAADPLIQAVFLKDTYYHEGGAGDAATATNRLEAVWKLGAERYLSENRPPKSAASESASATKSSRPKKGADGEPPKSAEKDAPEEKADASAAKPAAPSKTAATKKSDSAKHDAPKKDVPAAETKSVDPSTAVAKELGKPDSEKKDSAKAGSVKADSSKREKLEKGSLDKTPDGSPAKKTSSSIASKKSSEKEASDKPTAKSEDPGKKKPKTAPATH